MNNFPPRLRHDSGAWMELDETRLMLSFKKPFDSEAIPLILEKAGLVLEDTESKEDPGAVRQSVQGINHTNQRIWTRSPNGQQIDQEHFEKIEKQLDEELDLIEPVYQLADSENRYGLLCPLSNVLVIKPALSGDKAEKSLARLTERLGLTEAPAMSSYLGRYRYYVVREPRKVNAYRLRELLLEKERRLVQEALLQNMPLLSPFAAAPNDLLSTQWNMTQIGAPAGWQIFPGPMFPPTPSVVIAIFDSGCQLDHPDLLPNKFSDGTTFDNFGALTGIGTPRTYPTDAGLTGHGTWVVGVTNAVYNNHLDVAGLAGGCLFIPIAFNLASDLEVVAGIGYAVAQAAGASPPKKLVINMSFGNGYDRSHVPLDPGGGTDPTGNTWHTGFIDVAIAAAQSSGALMCAATHNHNTLNAITYPATNPNVIACGASDMADNRLIGDSNPQLPDFPNGKGSNYGPQMSVVAPGLSLPTTDLGNGLKGDFGYTSGATPHVSGLAALLFCAYPTLENIDIRKIIERTAEKTGLIAYTDGPAYPNGTWNEQLGYGRINAYQALDFADVFIKDDPTDDGTEPSKPLGGDFWDFSDIVIRTFDDNVFNPGDPTQSNRVERKNDNFLYIQVTNKGPREARNVVVNARITPFVGTQFVYPADWVTQDATHVAPTPLPGSPATPGTPATIAAGGSVIAKFSISALQTDDLWGWENTHPWHPCLLASVRADNDYAFASFDLFANSHPVGDTITRRNNLAQRNLTVVNLIAPFLKVIKFPFIVGNRFDGERFIEIAVDRGRLPRGTKLRLSLDEDGSAFPRVDFTPPRLAGEPGDEMVFLDRTRIETTLACCRGVLTLEKGSRFTCSPSHKLGKIEIQGGVLILEGDKRFVAIEQDLTVVRLEKRPNQIYPLALETSFPANLGERQQFMLKVAQRNEKQQVVGGAGVAYVVR